MFNPNQGPVPGLCRWEIATVDDPELEHAANGVVGDFDGDGHADVVLLPFVVGELNQALAVLLNA